MSKIIYHKNCRKHEAVSKAKRMLIKLYDEFEKPFGDIYANIQLTGVSDIDYREVKCYLDSQFSSLIYSIEKDIEAEKEYNHGYNIKGHITRLHFMEELNTVCSYIASYYPELEQKVVEFTFKETNILAKQREIVNYFKSNPINGFNAEYLAIHPTYERRIYPLTFVAEDLEGVERVIVKYL